LDSVSLVSVTAAVVVEVSRRDSSTLPRLAYFDKCTLQGTDSLFFFRSWFFSKAPQVTFFNRKSTSSRFWSKSSSFHQIK